MSGQIARPVLFSTPMIPRLLDGSKTQTRRLLKLSPAKRAVSRIVPSDAPGLWDAEGNDGRGLVWHSLACPYGEPGGHLWVQEAHRLIDRDAQSGSVIVEYASDETRRHVYLTEAENVKLDARTSPLTRPMPGRFMYRSLSRTTLDVHLVRAERLNEISPDDAEAEGIQKCAKPGCCVGWWLAGAKHHPTTVGAFVDLWDSINGERASWASNPFVWAISFRRVI